jgi:hypothetical protein
MAKIVGTEPKKAIAEGESKIKNSAQSLPYSPSWVDRLTDWVDRLPGPFWLFYLVMALVLVLIKSAFAWRDGSYPVATFFPFHVVDQSNSAYLFFIIHYLDNRAGAALTVLRSVLAVDDAGYERLRYQLTTMPARPTFVWSLVGLLFGLAYLPLVMSQAQLQSLMLFTSPTVTVVDLASSGLNWMVNAVFYYHTTRQLQLVSHIYTKHTNVNVFATGPLYGLSRVTAITTLALLFITFLYISYWIDWQFQTTADVAVVLAFVLVALASFVWPLYGVHEVLQEQKERRKGEVARRLEIVTDELHRRTDAGDYSDMGNLNFTIDSLLKEQSALEKISTWPWQPETLRVVVTALLLPIGLWVITRILERLGL